MKECLEDSSWKFWLGENSRKDFWKLHNISILAAKTANEAFKIVNDYGLLENQKPRWSEKIGEPPRKITPKLDKVEIKLDLERLEWFLNQSVNFRDALRKKLTNSRIT